MSYKIYHNPHCSKSRQALQILQDAGKEPDIIEYLKNPPSITELRAILQELGMSSDPRQAMRKSEDIYKELSLDSPHLSQALLIETIAENPMLLERPIVITPKGARIGRPPEVINDIL